MNADQSSLKTAFLVICVSTWVLCSLIFAGVAYFAPKDVKVLRDQMSERAELEKSRSAAG